jgi:serine/threonine protein kinase/predicted ATPase
MPLTPGTGIGRYEIVCLLGSGGMGEVYRARDTQLRRDVAIKVISQALSDDSVTVDRFIREGLAASSLNHPNVITIYEAGQAQPGRFIVMELVEGRTLRDLVRDGLDWERSRDIGRQVAEALAVAHAAQIIHRDVKPENVMVRADGYVKVLDFGLARLEPLEKDGISATVSFATGAGLVLGTIGYMSPEQAQGQTVTTASDVFALGVVLYEAFTGQHPFPAASALGVMHAILSDVPLAPSRIRPELPAAADQIVLECLQKDPRLRPSAADVASRLRGSMPSTALAPSAALPQVARTLVGRASELKVLEHAWYQASSGTGQVVAVAGEPGHGKTAMVESFLASLESGEAPVRVGRGRSSERLAGSEAYLPVLEALDSLLRNESHGSLARVMKTVAPTWHSLLASQPDHDPARARELVTDAGSAAQRLKREMSTLLEEASRLVPTVLFLDDLHWSDAATVELLAYVASRLPAMRVLVIVTYRPSELAHTRHPFLALKLDLQARRICREVQLGALPYDAVSRYMASEFPGHEFSPAFTSFVYQKTEGHPLFMVDLLRDLRLRGVLVQEHGVWTVTQGLESIDRDVPESVRSMIQRTIDALPADDRQLLAAAAVQGVDFDSAVVADALRLDEAEVEERLDRLEREHAFVRFIEEVTCADRTVTLRFRFTHVLYQNALFASLRATRRATLAGAMAAMLVRRWGDRAPEIALDLAVLFETARGTLAAARYFSLAAQSAARLFAHEEAERLARRGLDLLDSLPEDAARSGVELELQMTYALAIKTTRGYAAPESGAAYLRAREICQRISDPAQVIPVLMGLSAHYITAGEIGVCLELAGQLMEISNRIGDPHLHMVAEWSIGAALHHQGELVAAHAHLLHALELHDPAVHQARAWEVGIEPGIFCQCELSRTTWLLGRPEESLARIRAAQQQARELGHPQTLAFTLLFGVLIHHKRREPAEGDSLYRELVALCQQHGIAQELLWASVVHGWILFAQGDREAGLIEISRGLADQADRRSALLRPYFLGIEAEVLIELGQFDAAAAALDQAETLADTMSQHMFAAELPRIRARLVLARNPADRTTAEQLYETALAIARRQQALSLELRASTGLAALLAESGEIARARDALAPVYARFTEGHDTPDLKDAAALLSSLD